MAARLPSGPAAPDAAPPSALRAVAAVYTLFVLYGCLVPLDFTPVPWDAAWAKFRHIPEFHPGRLYRTDFAANVALFLLLAFLWAGSIGAGWRRAGALAKSLLVWGTAVLVQTALEFGQIFTPPRSVSLWDVIAAAWGAAAGVVAWWMAGGAVRAAFDRWGAARSRRGVAGWLVLAYSAFVVFYKIVPADITVNVASLQAKWERGMYRPIPFTSLGHDPIAAAFGLAAEALLWLPPAALLALGRGTRPVMAWAFTLLFAVGVETLQLTVQSRVSDSTDVLCAATGAAAGAMLAYRIRPDRSQEGDG